MPSLKDLKGRQDITWCPGCGHHGILSSLQLAMVKLGLEPHQVLMVTGIGNGSKTPQYMKVSGMHTLHGRDIAFAEGAKLANHELVVMTVSGDGNTYSEGGNHLVHACRRNIDMLTLVQNNQVYGLTKGQYSPTSDHGFVTKTSPAPVGAIEQPLKPLALAIVCGATFVARGFAKDPRYLSELIVQGIEHKGYAFIDVLQPCVVFNRLNTYDWYSERAYKVEEQEGGHDPTDKMAALEKAFEWGDRIPLGVIYKEERDIFEENVPALQDGTLVSMGVERDLSLLEEIKKEYI